ncbi:hypothetical protein LTS10_003966 [Elasticomyces elasticus]|nr:hypothetical protein LTS10_003966 [Elasticomyces elasticus]
MDNQVRAKDCDIPNKKLCPPQRTSALPGKTNYHYLSELEASRPSAEKARSDMRKRVNDCRDKVKMLEGLKRFGAEFKFSMAVPVDLVPLMANTEEKRDEILRRGRSGGEGAEMTTAVKQKVNYGCGSGDGYTEGWLRVL